MLHLKRFFAGIRWKDYDKNSWVRLICVFISFVSLDLVINVNLIFMYKIIIGGIGIISCFIGILSTMSKSCEKELPEYKKTQMRDK